MSTKHTMGEEEKLNHLIYETADSLTDRDGNVDMVGSSEFEIGTKSLKEFISHQREQVLDEAIAICREIYIGGADWVEWGMSDKEAGEQFDKEVLLTLKNKDNEFKN